MHFKKGKATNPRYCKYKQNIVAEIRDWRRIPAEQDEKKVGTQFKSNEQFLNILLPPLAAFWQRCTEYGIPLIQNFEVGKLKCTTFHSFTKSQQPHLNGTAEVEQAPGDDHVVVAAHEAGHDCASVTHPLQTGVNLIIGKCFNRQHCMFVQWEGLRYKTY